jgi:hypothetical protein
MGWGFAEELSGVDKLIRWKDLRGISRNCLELGSISRVSALFAMGKYGPKTAFIEDVVRVAKGGKQR